MKKIWTQFLLRWGFIAVLVLGFGVCAILDLHDAPLIALNEMMVSLHPEDLIALESEIHVRPHEFERYAEYFRMINRVVGPQPDAYGMLGFCLYHLGKPKEALAAYEKAISLNSSFLWFYYNAGMIAFQQGNYVLATEYFQKALQTNPQVNAMIITHSKIFADILRGVPGAVDITGRLKEGYALSVYFGRLSSVLAMNQGMAHPPMKVVLRVF